MCVFFKNPSYGFENLSFVLETERLSLYSCSSEDFSLLLPLLSNPVVTRHYSEEGKPLSPEQIARKVAKWTTLWKMGELSGITVFLDSGTFIGHVGLDSQERGTLWISYAFKPEYWGNGYGTEAIQAVVKRILPEALSSNYHVQGEPIRKLVTKVSMANLASVRILERAGMKKTGESRGIFQSYELNFSIQTPGIPLSLLLSKKPKP